MEVCDPSSYRIVVFDVRTVTLIVNLEKESFSQDTAGSVHRDLMCS